ncbi:TPA: hypothetical protein DCX15_04885 [bacterium]|nr:hypothetical protein [bacterium]
MKKDEFEILDEDTGKEPEATSDAVLEEVIREEEIIEESISKMEYLDQDGRAEVVVDESGLNAYLIITPPGLGGRPLDLKGAMDALINKGIVDIDGESTKEALRKKVFNQSILVARGVPPHKGKDAYLTNQVRTGEDVTPEQLLAVKVPATQGWPGRSVRGEVIPGLFGKDITLLVGENTKLSSDGLRIYATDYGEVRWEGSKASVNVTPRQEVDLEDVERDFRTLETFLKGIQVEDSSLDSRVEVILSEDKLEAYILIIPPKIGGRLLELRQVLASLKEKGIMEVETDKILKAIKEHRFNEKILVARGIPPTKGEDAFFIYRFGVDKEDTPLKEEAIPGQLLMIKHLATRGTSGKTVTGETIPGGFGKPLYISAGNGVMFDEEGARAYAIRSGRVIWEENKISVEEVKEIDGDLSEEDGDIEFSGMIIINGAVGDSVEVKAESDIIVVGGVGDATLISDGDIKVRQAVFGKGQGIITAHGNVSITSAEGITVEAGENVFVNEFIRNSNVIAKQVICEGQIDGGRVYANKLIEAKVLGSEEKTKTILTVDKEGRISSREAVHPGVELKIGGSLLAIKERGGGLSFTFEGTSIKGEAYTRVEAKESLVTQPAVKIKGFTPFVILSGSTPGEIKREGAALLDLAVEDVETEIISKDKETIRMKIFPVGRFLPLEIEEKTEKGKLGQLDIEGYYRLANTEEGLFLSVFPPREGGSRVKVENVLKEMESRGFKDVNEVLLKEVIDQALATPVKIAPRQYIPDLDGEVIIEISPDGRRAEMILIPPQPGGLPVSFKDATEALKGKGIVIGIKEEAIHQAIKDGKFGVRMIVAEEIPPTPGKSSKIEYHFDLSPQKAKFIEDEWGRVNFKELNIVRMVRAGQVLATKVGTAIPGQPGQRITGEQIPPPPVEDTKLPVGKNTQITEDGLKLCSTIDGHVLFVSGRVNVEPVYEVKGDVNLTTGNIDFPGTIDIAGNVEDGFRVRAGGDIQIRGGVGKATLHSEASVNISHGIQANHEGRIRAGKDIICKFVEMGNLFAGGDIIVDEEVLHSELNADGNIIVTGKRGLIIGGEIRARNRVRARVVGCKKFTPTIIEVGVQPRIRGQVTVLKRLLREDLKEFEQYKVDILNLKRQKETTGLSPEREELLSRLINTQASLAAKLHSYAQRKEVLEREMLRPAGGVIDVLEAVYPGTVVIIRNIVFEVTEKLKAVTFYLEGDKIRQRPHEG